MKKKRVAAMFMTVCMGIVGCTAAKDSIKYAIFEPIHIDFSKSMGDSEKLHFENQISEVTNKERLNYGYVSKYELSEEKRENLASKFDLDGSLYEYKDNKYQIVDGNQFLYVSPNGTFSYKNQSIATTKVAWSDEECIEQAEIKLKEYGFLPEEYVYGGIEYAWIETEEEEEENCTLKSVVFKHQFDGIEVAGYSSIRISFTGDGVVRDVSVVWLQDLEKCQIEEKNIIDIQNQFEEIDFENASYDLAEEEPSKIVVNKAEVVYWEDGLEGNSIFEPVYKVYGDVYSGEKKTGTTTIYVNAYR